MEEILHQLIGSISHLFLGFYTSQVVQDFLHQQYHPHVLQQLILTPKTSWISIEQLKNTLVVRIHRGLYYQVMWGLQNHHYKDPCSRTSISSKVSEVFFCGSFFFSICLVCSLMIQIPQAIPMKPALYRKPFFLLRRTAQFHPLSMSNYINPTNMFKYCNKTCD